MASNSSDGASQTVPNPDDYKHTIRKEEADPIASWASDFEVGGTIQWTHPEVDGVQESTVVGFSAGSNFAEPVIENPGTWETAEQIKTFIVDEDSWVPEDKPSVAEIEIEYTQRMTVKIPVDEMPPNEREAFHLVKNTDPEFVADALPSRWDDAVSVGELDVVDVTEEEVQ